MRLLYRGMLGEESMQVFDLRDMRNNVPRDMRNKLRVICWLRQRNCWLPSEVFHLKKREIKIYLQKKISKFHILMEDLRSKSTITVFRVKRGKAYHVRPTGEHITRNLLRISRWRSQHITQVLLNFKLSPQPLPTRLLYHTFLWKKRYHLSAFIIFFILSLVC